MTLQASLRKFTLPLSIKATEPGLGISDLGFKQLLRTNEKPLAFLSLCHSFKAGCRSLSIMWNKVISLMPFSVHGTLISAGIYGHYFVTG
ncbi:hypothetical protein CIB84_002994 [Bambusicola thoracicus]|uniref:Uncharacterized protein n=1 Tax=Bambusicola thoracicus TaxID=9083 RepID=A0A2P4TA97_BAMTH|nr:hypothetical protein CIB84_002994 [Bambusicola thoracicus]